VTGGDIRLKGGTVVGVTRGTPGSRLSANHYAIIYILLNIEGNEAPTNMSARPNPKVRQWRRLHKTHYSDIILNVVKRAVTEKGKTLVGHWQKAGWPNKRDSGEILHHFVWFYSRNFSVEIKRAANWNQLEKVLTVTVTLSGKQSATKATLRCDSCREHDLPALTMAGPASASVSSRGLGLQGQRTFPAKTFPEKCYGSDVWYPKCDVLVPHVLLPIPYYSTTS